MKGEISTMRRRMSASEGQTGMLRITSNIEIEILSYYGASDNIKLDLNKKLSKTIGKKLAEFIDRMIDPWNPEALTKVLEVLEHIPYDFDTMVTCSLGLSLKKIRKAAKTNEVDIKKDSNIYQNMHKVNPVTRTKSLSNRSQQHTLPVRSATTKHSDSKSSFLKKREPPIVRDITRRNVLESKNTKTSKRKSVEKTEPPLRSTSVRRNPKRIISSGSSNSNSSIRSSSSSHQSRISKDSKTSNNSNNEVSPVDEKQLPWNQYSTIPEENVMKECIETDYTDMIQQLNASQAFLIASKFSTSSFGQIEELLQKSIQLKATADSVYERIHVQTDTQRATVATLRLELLSLGKSASDMLQLRESSLQIDQLVDELYFSSKRASDLEVRYLQNVAGILAVIISSSSKSIAPPTPTSPSPHALTIGANTSNPNGLKLVKKIESLFGELETSHESIIDNNMSDDSELLSPSSTRFSKLACASDTSTDTDTEESLDDLELYQKLNILVDGLSERWRQKGDQIASLEALKKQNVEKNDEAEQQNTVDLKNLRALLKEETLKRQMLEDKLKVTEENYNLDQQQSQKEIQELRKQLENNRNQLMNENKENQVLIQNLKTQLEEISKNKQAALQRSQILQQQSDDLSKYIINSYNNLSLKQIDSYEPINDAKKAIHMFLEAFRGLEEELQIHQQANQTQKEEDEFKCNTTIKDSSILPLIKTEEMENNLGVLNNEISSIGNRMNHRVISENHDRNENSDDYRYHQDILEQQLMETQRQLGLLTQQYQVAQQIYITRESAYILQSASLEVELERIVKEYYRLTRNISDFHYERKKWQDEIHRLNNEKQELDKKLSDERVKRIAHDGQTKTLRKEFRTLIASVKDDHASAIEREIVLRRQIEHHLRDMKADEEMKRWERVDIAIQTEFDETIIPSIRTPF
ncbi:hypothetical protein K501DRAFT_328772 [Backusella circina FSU 941]|nr:hypothetical protein K501DRAFT_328772 [Backusella circina FSU 941]